MNRRTFEKKLNFEIKNNILTYGSIEELIKSEKKSLINNVSIEELLKQNLQRIIDNTLEGYEPDMFSYLYSLEFLEKDLDKILSSKITKYDYFDINRILSETKLGPKIIETIQLNIDKFIEEKKTLVLFELMTRKPELLTNENKKNINEYYSTHKRNLAKDITDTSEVYFHNIDEKEKNDYYDMISILVDELKDHSEVDYSDIKFISRGSYSTVYLIGDKIFKIGCERGTYEIPNNKRILQPLLRLNLSKSFRIDGTIEITNEADTNVNLTQEEYYNFFKEFLEDDIFPSDFKMDNIARLKKDNNYDWHEELGDDPSIRGLDRKLSSGEILKKGNLVIIDTDYIYKFSKFKSKLKRKDFGNYKVGFLINRYEKEKKEAKSLKLKKEDNNYAFYK